MAAIASWSMGEWSGVTMYSLASAGFSAKMWSASTMRSSRRRRPSDGSSSTAVTLLPLEDSVRDPAVFNSRFDRLVEPMMVPSAEQTPCTSLLRTNRRTIVMRDRAAAPPAMATSDSRATSTPTSVSRVKSSEYGNDAQPETTNAASSRQPFGLRDMVSLLLGCGDLRMTQNTPKARPRNGDLRHSQANEC